MEKPLWNMLIIIYVVPNIIQKIMIKDEPNKNTECAVDGQLTEWFDVHVGIRHGCLLIPTVLLICNERTGQTRSNAIP